MGRARAGLIHNLRGSLAFVALRHDRPLWTIWIQAVVFAAVVRALGGA